MPMHQMLYDWFGWNRQLFAILNGIDDPLLDSLMLLGSWLGDFRNLPWLLAALLAAALAQRLLKSRSRLARHGTLFSPVRAAVTLLLAYMIAAVLVTLLKHLFAMPRPPALLPATAVRLLARPDSVYSFPSGHATFAALVAVAMWKQCRIAARFFFVFFALWVGISRVVVGVHFPADVVGGWLCGALSGWLATRALEPRTAGAYLPRAEARSWRLSGLKLPDLRLWKRPRT